MRDLHLKLSQIVVTVIICAYLHNKFIFTYFLLHHLFIININGVVFDIISNII